MTLTGFPLGVRVWQQTRSELSPDWTLSGELGPAKPNIKPLGDTITAGETSMILPGLVSRKAQFVPRSWRYTGSVDSRLRKVVLRE